MILYLLSRAKHAKFSQHLLRVGYNNPLLNVLCLYVIIQQCCDNLSLLFDNLFNSELSRAWHTSLSKISMELKTAGSFTTAINAWSDFSKNVLNTTFGRLKDKNTWISIAINTLILRLNARRTTRLYFFKTKIWIDAKLPIKAQPWRGVIFKNEQIKKKIKHALHAL